MWQTINIYAYSFSENLQRFAYLFIIFIKKIYGFYLLMIDKSETEDGNGEDDSND